MNISSIIKEILHKNKLHPHELAKILKIDLDTVFKLINDNETPKAEIITELYKNFGIALKKTKYCPHFKDTECKELYDICNNSSENFHCESYIELENGTSFCKFYYQNLGFIYDINCYFKNNVINLNRIEALNRLYDKADRQEKERQKNQKNTMDK